MNFIKHLLSLKSLVKFFYSNKFLFLVLSLPIKIIDILFIKTRNEILFYGYRGRYNGNSSYLYRYYLLKKNNLNPIWLLDKEDLKYFDSNMSYFLLPNKNSNVLEHIKLLLKISFAKVVVVTSVGDLRFYCSLLYSKKRIEVLLPHGTTIKSGGVMAKHLSKSQKNQWATHASRFDIVSVSSRVEQYWVSSMLNLSPEKIKILGSQRGEISEKHLQEEKNKNLQLDTIYNELGRDITKTDFLKASKVLYAPTHRDHLSDHYTTLLEKIDGFNLTELNHFLKEENTILFLREHAVSNKNISVQDYQLESNIINLSSEKFPDLEKYLSFIDTIITDYSGVYLEHLISKKSLAFALLDIEEYEKDRGLVLPKEVLFPGYIFKSQKELVYYLKNRASIDHSYVNQRQYLYSLLFEKNSKGACNRTMKEIDNAIKTFSI
jgi:CDP-glycerol glycerophosphotransferase (TagB/SpsB family)